MVYLVTENKKNKKNIFCRVNSHTTAAIVFSSIYLVRLMSLNRLQKTYEYDNSKPQLRTTCQSKLDNSGGRRRNKYVEL